MLSLQKLLLLLSLFVVTCSTYAQNTDILWQKTLSKDTIPISSLAIAEGKYVAALKGDEIIILDYATGDSIKVFPKPKDMFGTDIILGKNGERLYVFTKGPIPNICYLHCWDIQTGFQFLDISMEPSFQTRGGSTHHDYYGFSTAASPNGILIVVQTAYQEIAYGIGESKGTAVKMFNTIDSILFSEIETPDSISFFLNKENFNNSIRDGIHSTINKSSKSLQSETNNVSFSQSSNYLLLNYTVGGFYRYGSGATGGHYSYVYGRIKSLMPELKSYEYSENIPIYKFSSADDFLLSGNNLYTIPPRNIFRTLNKIGFVFLPDDNHMLAFNTAGGIAAISNIEKDTWEKVYHGDSLTENIIQSNASRTAFATATNHRITLWKIPSDLNPADLAADFSLEKDTILIGDTAFCTNKTFPFKRSNNYVWNFGDGNDTNTNIHPFHIYRAEGTYSINLAALDTLGRVSLFTKNIVVKNHTTTIESTISNKPTFSIIPNPSYGETTLSYTLSQPANIQIKITDVLGREIVSWSLQEHAGEHALLWNGSNVGEGMYYCTFSNGNMPRTIPVAVMR